MDPRMLEPRNMQCAAVPVVGPGSDGADDGVVDNFVPAEAQDGDRNQNRAAMPITRATVAT